MVNNPLGCPRRNSPLAPGTAAAAAAHSGWALGPQYWAAGRAFGWLRVQHYRQRGQTAAGQRL